MNLVQGAPAFAPFDPMRARQPEPALLLAPFRRDADMLEDFLRELGIRSISVPAGDVAALAEALGQGIGMVIAAEEALVTAMLDVLRLHLDRQPAWSNLPVIILLDARHDRGDTATAARELLADRAVVLLQRPLRSSELSSLVRGAIAARERQLQVRDHLELQRELLRELQHRVKNMLANVGAAWRMTLRHAPDPQALRRGFEGRLEALTRVHGALADPAAGYAGLRDVLDAALEEEGRAAVELDGPDLRLAAPALALLGLAVHELASNARRHGALSVPEGRVVLGWHEEGGEFRLHWEERGGPPVGHSTHQGYGMRFLTAAPRAFRGRTTIEYAPAGLRCTIAMPWGAVAERQQ